MLILLSVVISPVDAQVYLKAHPAPEFGEGVVWLDQSAPVPHHISGYRNKVTVIDFWEYSCINCIRDFAGLKGWYRKYHPHGFEIVGVHYGGFNIGFDVDNVQGSAAVPIALACTGGPKR